jgi:CheY-like chemotaxis protein
LVDDDGNDVAWVRRALLCGRILNPLQVANDGQEAIGYLLGEGQYQNRQVFPSPILVLLDLAMPKMDGFDVLRWIKSRAQFANLPVIVLSGMADLHQLNRAYQLGAMTFMLKPLRAEDLGVRLPRLKGIRFVTASNGERYIEVADTVPVLPQTNSPDKFETLS